MSSPSNLAELLNELKAALAKMTPEEWVHSENKFHAGWSNDGIARPDGTPVVMVASAAFGHKLNTADREGICLLRNLAHRLVKAAERMKGELGCLTPDYPCEKWPCTTPGKPLCGHCQALADADRLAKGE